MWGTAKYFGLVGGVALCGAAVWFVCKKFRGGSSGSSLGSVPSMYTTKEWADIERAEKLLKAFSTYGETEFSKRLDPLRQTRLFEAVPGLYVEEDVRLLGKTLDCQPSPDKKYLCPVENLEKLEEERRERTQDILVAMTKNELLEQCEVETFSEGKEKEFSAGYQVCQNLAGQPAVPQHYDAELGAAQLRDSDAETNEIRDVSLLASKNFYVEKQGINLALMQDAWTLSKRVEGLRILRPDTKSRLNTIATGVQCDVMYGKIAGSKNPPYIVENPALFPEGDASRAAFVNSLAKTVVQDKNAAIDRESDATKEVEDLLQHLEEHGMGPLNMSPNRRSQRVGEGLGFASYISEPFLGSDHSPLSTTFGISLTKDVKLSVKVWQWNVLGWGFANLAQMAWGTKDQKYRFQAAIQAQILQAKLREWTDNGTDDIVVLLFQEDLGVKKSSAEDPSPLDGFWTTMLTEAGFNLAKFSSHEGLPAEKGQAFAAGVVKKTDPQTRNVMVCKSETDCREHEVSLKEGETLVMGNSVYVYMRPEAQQKAHDSCGNLTVKGNDFNARPPELYPDSQSDTKLLDKKKLDLKAPLDLKIPTRSVALGTIMCGSKPLLTAGAGHIVGGKFDDVKNLRFGLQGGKEGKRNLEMSVVETSVAGKKYRMVDPTTGLLHDGPTMSLNYRNGGQMVRDMVKLFAEKAAASGAENVILGLDANAKEPQYMDEFVDNLWATKKEKIFPLKTAAAVKLAEAKWNQSAPEFFRQAVWKKALPFVATHFKFQAVGRELMTTYYKPENKDIIVVAANPAFCRGEPAQHAGGVAKVVANHLAQKCNGVERFPRGTCSRMDGPGYAFGKTVAAAFRGDIQKHKVAFGSLANDIKGLGGAKFFTFQGKENLSEEFSVVLVAGLVEEMRSTEFSAGQKITDDAYAQAAKNVLGTAYKNLFDELGGVVGEQRVWLPFVGWGDKSRSHKDRWNNAQHFTEDTVEMWQEAYDALSSDKAKQKNLRDKTFIAFDAEKFHGLPLQYLENMGLNPNT